MESHFASLNLAIIFLLKATLLVAETCSKIQRGETPPEHAGNALPLSPD